MAKFNIPYWISNWWNKFWSREAPVTNLKISFLAKLIYLFIFLFAFKKKPRLVLTYWNLKPILTDLQLATWKSFPFATAIIAYHLACFLRQVYIGLIIYILSFSRRDKAPLYLLLSVCRSVTHLFDDWDVSPYWLTCTCLYLPANQFTLLLSPK